MHSIRQNYVVSFAAVAGLLALLELWIVQSVWFPLNADVLSLAITIDLTFGIPLVYYLLLVRTGSSPVLSLAPVFLASIVLANAILPSSQHTYLDRIEYGLPLIEGAMLLLVAFKTRSIVHEYRRARPAAVYATDALAASLQQTFGRSRVVALLVTELSILYYIVCGWFRRFSSRNATHVVFSYHQKSGYGAVLCMMALLVALETFGVHLIVERWSGVAAWTLTILSLYSLVWLIADYHAARLHPIIFTGERLHIRTGLRWRIDIAWNDVAGVEKGRSSTKQKRNYLNAALYGEPQFVLLLRQPVTAYGLFGMEKQVRRIGLTVDNAALFQFELSRRVQAEPHQ